MNIIYVYDSMRIRKNNINNNNNNINNNNNSEEDCIKNNKNHHHQQPSSSAIKKCLFGTADPGDTEKLLNEQQKVDRLRFMDMFGFDLDDIENIENLHLNTVTKRPTKKFCSNYNNNQKNNSRCDGEVDEKVSRKRRRLTFKSTSPQHHHEVKKPKNSKITDFYKITKTAPVTEEDQELLLKKLLD